MKRVMFDVPDTTTVISITYIYHDETTFDLMVGTSIVTKTDNPAVMSGKEAFIVRASDRSVDDDD